MIIKINMLPLCALAAIGLTGCQSHQDDVKKERAKNAATVQQPDTCGAGSFSYLIGKPASALDTLRFAQPMRHITPDTAVTMDYRAERLNIESDEKGVITRLYCS